MQKHVTCDWETFDDFVRFESSIWSIMLNGHEWRSSKCSCPFFAKNFKCEHIIALAVQAILVEISLSAKVIPLTQKRKRGRSTLSLPALVRQ